ncbi:unnamed protein product, partial [Linum tenue]
MSDNLQHVDQAQNVSQANQPAETGRQEAATLEGTQAQGQEEPATRKVKKKGKAPPLKSDVWTQFKKYLNEKGEVRASCKYCGKDYAAHPVNNGTSAMKKHMNPPNACNAQTNGNGKDTAQQLLSITPNGAGDASVAGWKFDQYKIRKSLARMIIMDELPFKFVEHLGFKLFMADACPRFNMPSRWTVSRDCFDWYFEEKEKLKMLLNSSTGTRRVSLTTDTWTSLQRTNYMCLT